MKFRAGTEHYIVYMSVNQITAAIVDASFKIHQVLGPGLLESVYEEILAYELVRRGLGVERQKPISITYEGLAFAEPFRADMVVNHSVLVELKSVESLQPIHTKQTLTYIRLAGLNVGLLINFNVPLIKDGIRRIVSGLPEPTS
jgi:GxxExxY protein